MATLIRTIGSPIDNGSGPIEVNSPLRSPADPPSTSFYQNMFNGLNAEYFHPTGGYSVPGQHPWTASEILGIVDMHAPPSPFIRTRVNMGGQVITLGLDDPRYTANEYQSFAPALYSQYKAGTITGSQMFARAWPYMDRDTMNTSNFNFSAPPRVHFNFTGSGGGSISGTGISFGGLRGTWTGGSTRSFNFGF